VLSLFVLRRSFRLDLQLLEGKNPNLFCTFGCRSVLADVEKIEAQRKAFLDGHLLVSDLSALCLEYVPDLFCHLDDEPELSSSIDPKSNAEFLFPLHFSLSTLSTL
jgi:hypothetical protein